MNETSLKPFGDIIAHAIGGGWGDDEPTGDSQPVLVIRGADFPEVAFQRSGNLPLRYETKKRISSRSLEPGDIVLEVSGGTRDRPTGRTVYVTDDLLSKSDHMVIPASFCRLVRIDSDQADSYFVYYFLQDLYNSGGTWEYQNQSTGISNFQFDLFCKKLSFPALSISEQRAIAEVLRALDDKITANMDLARTVDDYLAAALLMLLNSQSVDKVTLKEIADVNAGSTKPSPIDRLRYIDIASVSVGHFDFPSISDWASAPARARRRVRKGDTLWSTVRPNRRSHALNLSDDPLLVGSTGLAVLSPRETGFAYLYEVTKLPEFTTYLEGAAEGSAYPAVRAHRFGDAPVPLLPAIAREIFESVAASMREHTFYLGEQNRTLALTRDALLPQLILGKIRLKDAEKTVEEVL